MKSVVSIIDNLLEEYHSKDAHGSEELNDHVILGIDVNEKGDPCAKVVKVQGKSINVLGMLALLEDQIANIKEKVRGKFNELDNKKEFYDALPTGVAEKLQDLEKTLRDRLKNGESPSPEEIEELKNRARKIFEEGTGMNTDESSSKRDDDGFDINDFKPGF